MESNSDDDHEDASPTQQKEPKPGGSTERGSIMSQIAQRQATQQAGSDQQQDKFLSEWSSAIRGNIHDYQGSGMYENEEYSLIEEEEENSTRDVYVIPPLKMAPPAPPKPVSTPPPLPVSATDKETSPFQETNISRQAEEIDNGHIPSPEGSPKIPSKEQGITHIPSQEGSPKIPSKEQGSTHIPSQEQEGPNIPSQEQEGTNIPSQTQGSTHIPSQEQEGTNIPSQGQGGTNIPSQEQGGTNIPSQGQESPNIPSQGQEGDGTIAPSKEEGSTRISSLEDSQHVGGSTDVFLKTGNHAVDTGDRSKREANERASTEASDLELHSVPQHGDNRESETEFAVAKSTSDGTRDKDSTTGKLGVEGRADVKGEETPRSQSQPPETHPKPFKLQSEPFKFIVDGGSIQDRSRSEERAPPIRRKTHIDSHTSTGRSAEEAKNEDRKSVQDIRQMFEKSKPDVQQRKSVPQGTTSIPVPQGSTSKSLSPGTDRKPNNTNQGDNEPNIPRPEDSFKIPDRDNTRTAGPEVVTKGTAVGSTVKPDEEMDKDRDDEDDYETAEEDQDEDGVEEKTDSAVVSIPPQKSVNQLAVSQGTEFSDSHNSIRSDTSAGLGSDNVGSLIRTNIFDGSAVSSTSSKMPDRDQFLSHPTVQPGAQLSERPEPSTADGVPKGGEKDISNFTSLTEGVSQQMQQPGKTNIAHEGIQPTMDVPQLQRQVPDKVKKEEPFQGHLDSPQHHGEPTQGQPRVVGSYQDQQIHHEGPAAQYPFVHTGPSQGQFQQAESPHGHPTHQGEPVQGQPLHTGPSQGQFQHVESPHGHPTHHGEPVQGQPIHTGPFQGQFQQAESPHGHPTHHVEPVQGQPMHTGPFQGQFQQAESPHGPPIHQYQWQQMERENWSDGRREFAGHLGNTPPQQQPMHDPRYHGMYGQLGAYQPHSMGQEYYPQGQWGYGLNPQDIRPQHTDPAGQWGDGQNPQDIRPQHTDPAGQSGDGQNPQDIRPQHTDPASHQAPKVPKVKEKPSAKQPKKTKPPSQVSRTPKGATSPEPPKTDKKERKEVPKPKKPEKPEKSYVCVKGLNPNSGSETLLLFLENKSGCDVDKSSVLYTSDKTMAVATFLSSPHNFQEFKNKCQQKKLEGSSVRVCVVQAPVTVVVSSEHHMPSEHEMKKHFQQEKFGWVKVRRIRMTDDGCYRVEFKDNAAFEKVCHSPYPHKIGAVSLCVSPLYECEFGEIWEEEKHKVYIPDSIILKHTDHHKMHLIKNYEAIKDLLQSKLKPKLAKLKVTDQLHVECTMDQKTEGVRQLVKSWESDVNEIWKEFIDRTVQQYELLVTAEVWKDLFSHVKEHKDHDKVHVHFQAHEDDVRLVVVGIESLFITVTEKIYQHKDSIEKAIERKKQITTDTKHFKSLEIRLLGQLDILAQVNTLAEDLNVTADEELGTITFNGIMEDIDSAQTIIKHTTQQFRLWTIQGDSVMNNDQVRLLQNSQIQNILKEKFTEHKLVVELNCTADGIEVGTESASAEQDVTRIINSTVTFSEIPLTDTEKMEVLKTFPWKQQCQQIQEDSSGLVIISTMRDYGFKVTSTDTIHQDILRQLLAFIDEHAEYEDRYDINDEGKMKFFKMHYLKDIKDIQADLSAMSVSIVMEDKGLAVSGTRQGIKQAKERLNTLEDNIKSKHHDIQRLGIGTVVNPDNAGMFCGIESETNTVVMQHKTIVQVSGSQGSSDEEQEDFYGTEESYTWGRTGMIGAKPKVAFVAPQPHPVTVPAEGPAGVTCKNGLKIKLVRGEIGKEKADVLVVSTSQDLELEKAGAGKSLVKYGGSGLQAELKANHPSKVNHGDIIAIGPSKLKCKQVFLCNLPEWEKDKNNKPMVITKVIIECLTKAAKAGYSTVKFVALGTGALKYPPQCVAETMYDAVHQYDAKGTTSVSLVTFVLYSSDHRTTSAFEDEEYNQIHPGGQTRSTGLKGPFDTKHGIKVTLVKGLMDSQTVDVITCATNKNLDMAGGVATAMSKAAGPALQADCKAKYPSGIEFGDVAAVTSGNLRTCKSIYLTSLPGWKNQDGSKRNDVEKLLKTAVTTCLQKAAQSGYRSVAFPAIGTGQNGYPRDTVAKLMYDYVVDFASKNTGTSLTDVRFVLHQKDRETILSFEKEEQMRLSPSRAYTSSPLQSFYTKSNRLQVAIDTCSIADFQKADVIAATVSDDLDLSKGGAMVAISKNGGITLKAECEIKYPNGIKIGDLAEISPGNLSCQALYLGTLPSYNSGPAAAEKALDKYIQKVLDTASSKGYTSVAFPAVGTGYNNYPHARAATLCYEAVQHFDRKSSSIKTVYFVILQKDAASLNAFQREEQKRNGLPFGGPSPFISHPRTGLEDSSLGAVGGVNKRGTFMRVFSKRDEEVPSRPRRRTTRPQRPTVGRQSNQRGFDQDPLGLRAPGAGCMSIQGGKTNEFVYGKVTLKVNVEDIVKLKDPVDVIVNSTNKDLDFTKGAVSKEIVKMCDPKQLGDECEKLKPEMKRRGIVCTSGCGLAYKAILHIEAQSTLMTWKKMILTCLQEADRRGHTSIAFPVLGTAGGGVQFKPGEIAETLHDSLQHFSGSTITLVRLVIFDQKMLWSMQKVFRDNVQRPSTSVAEDYNVMPGSQATDPSRVSLWILGTSDYNIDDAIDRIKKLIEKKYSVKNNKDTLICQLDDNEMNEIKKLNKMFLVEVKVDKQASVIKLDGPLEQVDNATQELHRLLSHFQSERHQDAEANFIAELVQWFYQETDHQGQPKLSEYPPRINMRLENSRKGNHPSFKFSANGNEYVVDLLTMQESAVADPTDTAHVIRREKLQGGKFELPADWDEMTDRNEIVKVIPLAASSQTYKDTETMFKNSVLKGFYANQFNAAKLVVHKIERVQNRSLYQQYSIKKDSLEQKNPKGTTNQQLLWHGTADKAITSINYYGFNRSYCGSDQKKGPCWYGAGVYFADDASYSARDWVSVPSNQKKSMYLCKVLTGVSCPAAKDMKYLPPIPGNPSQNYDSAVQQQNKLKEFIIFNDTQAYPEFLITFSTT